MPSSKLAKSKIHSSPKTTLNIHSIFAFALSIFIILIPFYRGLYFRENYIPSIIAIGALFFVYMILDFNNKKNTVYRSYLDILITLIPVAYFISFLFSVNSKDAFDAVLKYTSYAIIYFMASMQSRSENNGLKVILNGVLFSNFLVAITGVLTMAGLLDLKGVTMYNRLYGLYQYPNTTAAILASGIFICLGLMINSKKKIYALIYQAILTSLYSAFVLTLSAGSFLIFLFVMLVYFFISDSKTKIYLIAYNLIGIASNILIYIKFFNNGLSNNFILIYAISIFITATLQYGFQILNRKYFCEANKKTLNTIVFIMIAIIILSILMLVVIKGNEVKSLSDKVWNVDLKAQNASDRIIFTKDGFRIFLDHFLVGTGGGGWQNLYKKYQSFSYNTAEAHNFFMQLMIETGIIGTFAITLTVIILVINLFKEVFKQKRYEKVHIYMAIAMILGHAVIDFDLSLAAPAYILWILFGLAGSDYKNEKIQNSEQKFLKPVAIIICTLVIILSSSIYSGMVNGDRASKLANKDAEKAITLYEKAMKHDKFNAAYRVDYAQIMNIKYNSTQDANYAGKMVNAINEVIKYEPFNNKYTPVLVNLLLSTGKLDEAVAVVDNMVMVQPMVADTYMFKINVNYEIAKYYFNNSEHVKAIPYLEKMLETEKQFNQANSRSIRPLEKSDKMDEMIMLAKNWISDAEKRKQ